MVKSICKGLLCAVGATLAFVLLFALILQWTHLSNGWIKPIMQIVKVICIFWAVAIVLKHAKSFGWLYGGLVGLLYMIFTFLIFALLDGNFTVGLGAVADLAFQILAGVVSALLLRMRNKDVVTA